MKTRSLTLVFLVAPAFLALAAMAPVSTAQQEPIRETPVAKPDDSAAGHVVVVELFTSQGCSTCPPADRLLAALGAESAGRVVPLSFHVDFWNHAGWTDPFSRGDWTRRQEVYARARGLQQLYTPQAVVDGGAELLGSDGRGLRAAVAAAAARPAAAISLRLEPTASKVLVEADVDRPEALRGRKLDLILAVFETGLITPVGRGENGGRTLRNDYVVRSLRRGGRLAADGPSRTRHTTALPVAKEWSRSHLGVAAFLQDPRSLEICGAKAQALASREGS
ncbi:MAG: DUF1223 domain-containing protein [Thermoanaerobaculia bacterium]